METKNLLIKLIEKRIQELAVAQEELKNFIEEVHDLNLNDKQALRNFNYELEDFGRGSVKIQEILDNNELDDGFIDPIDRGIKKLKE